MSLASTLMRLSGKKEDYESRWGYLAEWYDSKDWSIGVKEEGSEFGQGKISPGYAETKRR